MTNPAEGYETFMVPTLFGPWAGNLVAAADLKAGDRVLDLACGTGVVARRVAQRLGPRVTVTGLDLNPNMLSVARTAAANEGVVVDWREGSAEHLPFADASFDVVLCQFALMFFADRAAALGEIRRVLTAEGRALVSVWQGFDRHPFYQTLHDVIQRRVGTSALQDIFALGRIDELRTLLTRAGFTDVAVDAISMTARFPNPDGFLAGEIDVDTAAIPSMQHLDGDGRQALIAAISADMKAPLDAVTRGDHVALEFHAHVARCRKPHD